MRTTVVLHFGHLPLTHLRSPPREEEMVDWAGLLIWTEALHLTQNAFGMNHGFFPLYSKKMIKASISGFFFSLLNA